MNVNARQLSIEALDAAKRGATESRVLREQALAANRAFIAKPNSVNAGRRAMLAAKAFDTRMNAEVARVRAAYALLAASEQDKLASAQQVLAQVKKAEDKQVLVRNSKFSSMRVNAMVQAMNATDEALRTKPQLPAHMSMRPPSAQQVNIGMSQTFRSSAELERMSQFFPSDIRAAAASLSGVSDVVDGNQWLDAFDRALREGAESVSGAARLAARRAANVDPSSAALSQQAEAIASSLAGLGQETASVTFSSTAAPSKFGLKHVALGLGIAGGLYFLYTRS